MATPPIPRSDSDMHSGAALDELRIDASVDLVRRLVREAAALDEARSPAERRRRRRLHALVRNPSAAAFTVALTDEVARIRVPSRAAGRFARLVHQADLSGFPATDRVLLVLAAALARPLPRVVMPLVTRRLRNESAGVILPAEDPAFAQHLARRRREGMRANVNVLGEAIIGELEAQRRTAMVLERLHRHDVDHVSVKISAICPGISALAFDNTVSRVTERLRPLYRAAAAAHPPTLINLDMEEYRDLALTIAVFEQVLGEPELEHLDAGIVLQAYLPDAHGAATRLAEWARARERRAGGRIKVRVVKGANLAMEHVEAELRGWVPAPYATKAEVDASYKALLDRLCDPRYDRAVRIGVASHNLFDVAWALGLKHEMSRAGRPERLEIEMLEGMAPSQADAVAETAGHVLLYTPVVTRTDFPAAVAYLVRRLDENTSAENFLSHLFDLGSDDTLFEAEAERFRRAVHARPAVDTTPRRHQDRRWPPAPHPLDDAFANAPDTDWTVPANRDWLGQHLARPAPHRQLRSNLTAADVDAAVGRAREAGRSWARTPLRQRAEILNAVGDVLEANRGPLLGLMADEAGKAAAEGDPEVSEAVDFARYDARDSLRLGSLETVVPMPLGTVVVAPPWNFPLAIPAGGVLAALAAGNAVVLKPAPQSPRTAARLAELCWEAGVPRDVLQLLALPDGEVAQRLITHPNVDAVVLTGSYATASMFHGWRPGLRLHAETSGKNAIVVTATADVDQAVADLVRSAFGHAGQKCSAASLAILEAPLHDDPAVLERIRDAAATLRVGPSTDPATEVGPLIDPPGAILERALTRLEPGESWLLAPECRSVDGRLWSPGIRTGVQPGSWFARTECFGPVLGIVRARDLAHATTIQNATDYGLTAGLHALDPAEIEWWMERVEAGNLYVNRGITGAIVGRQPFGGWKRSAVGPTAKAGGPNYVASLSTWSDAGTTELEVVAATFERWMQQVGRVANDATGLTAERNVLRYRPLPGGVAVRFGPAATDRQRALVGLAARATGCRLVCSEHAAEPAEPLAARVGSLGVDRLRLVGDPADGTDALRAACHAEGVAVDDADPVSAPEVELPRWLREQAVAITNHRHGRVPDVSARPGRRRPVVTAGGVRAAGPAAGSSGGPAGAR
jgi:RHH-type transcriptional regulator, proline utilization regulon repressor / proline dehydrogenase / delta 1-pyrroline-5-carboxylate dehydrogenase